ncbi:MAG: DNA-directed RNA polymerase subunit G [Desulfurococcaceae archaeon]
MSLKLEECIVKDVMPLRVPKTFRIKGLCKDKELEIELHEEIVPQPKINTRFLIELLDNKEQCLQHEICGQGYVVSATSLENFYRVVISLHGFLLVIKSKDPINLDAMQQLYMGMSFVK